MTAGHRRLIATAFVLALAVLAEPLLATPLPTDARIVTGKLDGTKTARINIQREVLGNLAITIAGGLDPVRRPAAIRGVREAAGAGKIACVVACRAIEAGVAAHRAELVAAAEGVGLLDNGDFDRREIRCHG